MKAEAVTILGIVFHIMADYYCLNDGSEPVVSAGGFKPQAWAEEGIANYTKR